MCGVLARREGGAGVFPQKRCDWTGWRQNCGRLSRRCLWRRGSPTLLEVSPGAAQPRLQPRAHFRHLGEVLLEEPVPAPLAPSELGSRLLLGHGLSARAGAGLARQPAGCWLACGAPALANCEASALMRSLRSHSCCAAWRFPPASPSSSATSLFADHSAVRCRGAAATTWFRTVLQQFFLFFCRVRMHY